MTTLEKIQVVRDKIALLNAEIDAIYASCEHDYHESEHDSGILAYTYVERRCVKCGHFGGCWQKRRTFVPTYPPHKK
jgi:hypothetical protein